MKESARYLFLFLAFFGVLTIEHVIGLPFLTFTFAIFLFASFPLYWRNGLFVLGSIILAIVYLLPFWLSFVLIGCLRASIEFLVLDHRYEDIAIVLSVVVTTGIVAVWQQYSLSVEHLLVLLVQSLLFGLIMVYFVRQRQPHQRLRVKHAN
jgi:hypothetical protein